MILLGRIMAMLVGKINVGREGVYIHETLMIAKLPMTNALFEVRILNRLKMNKCDEYEKSKVVVAIMAIYINSKCWWGTK